MAYFFEILLFLEILKGVGGKMKDKNLKVSRVPHTRGTREVFQKTSFSLQPSAITWNTAT